MKNILILTTAITFILVSSWLVYKFATEDQSNTKEAITNGYSELLESSSNFYSEIKSKLETSEQ